MGVPRYGQLQPSARGDGGDVAHRFDDERVAEAYAASVDAYAKVLPCTGDVNRLIAEAYLAGLKQGKGELT